MKNLINKNLIWTEGRKILNNSVISLISVLFLSFYIKNYSENLAYLGYIISLLILLFIIFSIYFFRNPVRFVQIDFKDNSEILICPCDGRVIDINFNYKNSDNNFSTLISIFLSPFDVHVNWIPIDSKIIEIKYKSGEFLAAYAPKSSILNERNDIILQDSKKRTILVRQIAGMVARRIVCWVKEGDYVQAGQKYGMIKFGSRVDILLPKQVAIDLKINQRVRGGQTVLGRWI